MAGQTYPTRTLPSAQVAELGATPNELSGALAEVTDIALMVTDTGRPSFPTTNFKTLAVTSTATSLDQLTNNKEDVPLRRGIQLFAPATNTKDVVIGGADVAASATVANINGLPLPAGSSLFIEVTRLSEIFVDTESGTQYLHWLGY